MPGGREPRRDGRGFHFAVLLASPGCASCGRRASNADHILQRGAPHFGDDDPRNGLAVCGTGTTGCHGARHGSPYVDATGRRWTPEEVKRRLGEAIVTDHDRLLYLYEKLGVDPARAYIAREYGFDSWQTGLAPTA